MNIEKLRQSVIDLHPINNEIFENYFNENISFQLPKPITLEAKHTYEVYFNRYIIQKNITNSNIVGYDVLLKNLKQQRNDISIYQIKTRIGFISCFFDNSENLLGVLWNVNKTF